MAFRQDGPVSLTMQSVRGWCCTGAYIVGSLRKQAAWTLGGWLTLFDDILLVIEQPMERIQRS